MNPHPDPMVSEEDEQSCILNCRVLVEDAQSSAPPRPPPKKPRLTAWKLIVEEHKLARERQSQRAREFKEATEERCRKLEEKIKKAERKLEEEMTESRRKLEEAKRKWEEERVERQREFQRGFQREIQMMILQVVPHFKTIAPTPNVPASMETMEKIKPSAPQTSTNHAPNVSHDPNAPAASLQPSVLPNPNPPESQDPPSQRIES